jgi:hypothetical protein
MEALLKTREILLSKVKLVRKRRGKPFDACTSWKARVVIESVVCPAISNSSAHVERVEPTWP